MQLKFRSIAVLVTLLAANGCNNQPSSDPTVTGGDIAPATITAHGHPSEGPHGGGLVELGNSEYHAEVVHTDDTVTVYLLDRSARNAVAIDAQEITINAVRGGQPEQFRLAAVPQSNDESGKASAFALQDAELVKLLGDETAAPRLIVVIDGTSYRGEVHHGHAHGEGGRDPSHPHPH